MDIDIKQVVICVFRHYAKAHWEDIRQHPANHGCGDRSAAYIYARFMAGCIQQEQYHDFRFVSRREPEK
jgi:uncharacterized membrane protein